MSTSTNSRQPPTGTSPLIAATIQGTPPPNYALDTPPSQNSSILEEASSNEPLPSITIAVHNLTARHVQEIRDSIEPTQPRIGHNVKKLFRDFYIRVATTIFDFLDKPISESKNVSQAYQILKRFGKGEYNGNKNKIRDLILDVSSNEIIQNINNLLQETSQMSLSQWIQQTRIIVEQWKKATVEYSNAEKKLSEHCNAFDEIYKHIQLMLQLPPSEGYEELLGSSESYLKKIFDSHSIEEDYLELVRILKKITILTDAFSSIRQLVNASAEPLCSICITNIVGLVSIPCGHTFCSSCCGRQSMTCYICRVPVRDIIKIYFS